MPAGDRRAWRVLVALYPPSWRERYGQELLALLADGSSCAPAGTAASLAGGALAAWVRPAHGWLGADARLRASVAGLLAAWVALAGAALVFGQLAQDQSRVVDHPVLDAVYRGVVGVACASLAVLLGCCAPLWGRLARTAWARRDGRGLALVAAPLVVPAGFVLVLAVAGRAGGVGAGAFLALTVVGAVAAGAVAAGPALAVRRYSPAGATLRLPLVGLGLAVALLGAGVLGSAADLVAVRTLHPPGVVHAAPLVLVGYVAAILAVLTGAATSAVRAARSSTA